jgi:hypothetical protein
MKFLRPLSGLWLALATLGPLTGAPVPHPDQPGRLVEIRGELTVEYSPGQEAWMEMAFAKMKSEAFTPAALPPAPAQNRPALPGAARDLRARRAVLLAAIAKQTGLPAATELQGRAFDTFLGYYDMLDELMQILARELPTHVRARRLAIWSRDDLVARLRAGARIEGMFYDATTDSGRFEFKREFDRPDFKERFAAIQAAIDQQRLKHSFNLDKNTVSASFSLSPPSAKSKEPVPATASTPAGPVAELVVPIIYRGDASTPPSEKEFSMVGAYLGASIAAMTEQAATYRNAAVVCTILHETAEIGLVENLIASPDRRWLCDGTANYVAWRVARDLIDPDFARQVYDLDAQLRLHAASQPKLALARWPAVENQKQDEGDTDLNRAHYAFATRTMFLLAERHGENALAQLWADVARTPKKKVSAKTFAAAYRKRFKADLNALIQDAETMPIPPAPPPAKKV